MSLRSLRLRLLAGGAVAILASLAVAWLAMTLLFARHLERREAQLLDLQALPLIAGLRLNPGGAPVVETEPTDTRFQRPAAGLYWQVTGPGGVLRSRSLWDQALPPADTAAGPDWHTRRLAGPAEDQILLMERRLPLEGTIVVVQLAADLAPLAQARSEFAFELFLFLAGLWVVLCLAAALQVRLGLQPLAALREAIGGLRRNPTERLTVADHRPVVAPLVVGINALATAREQDLGRARRRAADLAHGLKTPLSSLAAQSRKVRQVAGPELADGMDKAIGAAAAAVEAELARARAAAGRQTEGAAKAPLAKIAEQVVSVVERTEVGLMRVFEICAPPSLCLLPSPEDMLEILGALTENAARFARRRVRISASEEGGWARLSVEDDGPGIADLQANEMLVRGRRLDESGPGHGLGLAIARDLVEAHGGQIALGRSDLGGLRVDMQWPVGERRQGPVVGGEGFEPPTLSV